MRKVLLGALMVCLSQVTHAECEHLIHNKSRFVSTYGQVQAAVFHKVASPGSEAEITSLFDCVSNMNYTVTIINAGWSFGDQILPAKKRTAMASERNLLLDVSQLKKVELASINEEKNALSLTVGAGVTWGEAIQYVHESLTLDVVPFDAPISDDISISGSVASHTVSRSSGVTGNYSIDYIDSLRLITPKETISCNYRSANQHEACQWVSGSFGKLGVISELTVRMQILKKNEMYITSVLGEYRGLKTFINNYLERSSDNSKSQLYDHGILGQLQSTDMENGRGFIIGTMSQVVTEEEQSKPNTADNSAPVSNMGSFPLFDGPTYSNLLTYILSHKFSGSSDNRLVNYYTKVGSAGINTPFEWYFFQKTHAQARRLMEGMVPGFMAKLFGIDSRMRTGHQAWFIPGDSTELLVNFITALYETAETTGFVKIRGMIQMQDLARIPASRHPGHVTYKYGHGHLFTLSLAIHSIEEEQLSQDFLTEVSRKAMEIGVQPYLIKEQNIDDRLLQQASQSYTQGLMKVSSNLDPDCIIYSRLWERIYPDCYLD